MKKLLLLTSLAAIAASTAFAAGHGETVRMGTEGAYPPYNFLNDAGEVDGLEREVGDEVCKRAELTCEWVTNDWDSIIPNLVSGNYDTIIAGMSITAERDEVIDFTQNYVPPVPSAFLAPVGTTDLSEAVIAAQTGTIQAGYIASTGATLLEFASPDETIAAVRNGEVDAVLADKDFLTPFAEESADLELVGEEVSLGGGIGIGVRESDPELKAKLDAAIQSMKDDGTLNALIEKWLPGSALF
ncbi:transporter substrate-binding domain-containing protein [Tropicimonas sp. S265A]|uniref:transporter substrate-binding domain-containing protein n=1 Tax=Tropicimonas sp. S265A TaxID=3415134 RepID=UPI003C7D63B8